MLVRVSAASLNKGGGYRSILPVLNPHDENIVQGIPVIVYDSVNWESLPDGISFLE